MKVFKRIVLGLVSLFFMIGLLEFAIDIFLDNASSIDACLDMGGAWDYNIDECKYQ